MPLAAGPEVGHAEELDIRHVGIGGLDMVGNVGPLLAALDVAAVSIPGQYP
jgi:hypothetical protein